MKSISKWTSTFALALSLAAWWFAANYSLCMPNKIPQSEDIQIQICDGVIYVCFYIPLEGSLPDTAGCYPYKVEADWGWFLPRFERTSMSPKISQFDPDWHYEALLPMWLPTALLALTAALFWKRSFRRIRPGHCRECGYDLTGNTSGVCSECGEKTAMANSK